jgi:hypothetical protein
MSKTVSFRITTQDNTLILKGFDDTVIEIDEEDKITTTACPRWVLDSAITTNGNIRKAADIIARREEANTVDVLEFLVKGFSPSAIKALVKDYNQDKFILGTYKNEAYGLPRYVQTTINTYEELSGDTLDIYFPSGTIGTLDEIYQEIEAINAENSEEDMLEVKSFPSATYVQEIISSILFGDRKQLRQR